MTDKRKSQLLTLLSLLLLAKFVVQPLIAWQGEQVDSLRLLEKRVVQGQKAIENADDYKRQQERLKLQLTTTEGKLFKSVPETAFRLEQQSWIERQLQRFNITAESIAWSPVVTLDGGVIQHRMELTIVGDVDDVVKLQHSLEQSNEKFIRFLTYNWVVNRHLEFRVGEIRGSGTLAFYMEPGGDR